MSLRTLKLPIKLNDRYTCQGHDRDDQYVTFDDLLFEGDRVATVSSEDGADTWGPYGIVVLKDDGLWVVAQAEAHSGGQRR